MDLVKQIAAELQIKISQVENTVRLLDEGNTIPFIARYRKEATGSLNEEELRQVADRLNYLRNLAERKAEILKSIEAQGKLTPDLKTAIDQAVKLQDLEDIYRPFRPKRKTRATVARSRSLEPLSRFLLEQTDQNPLLLARQFVNPELGLLTEEDCLAGAMDILAEEFSDHPDYRKNIRLMTYRSGLLVAKGKTEEVTTYEMYYD
ncbi:MAG TPA: RNA-binding transcriptional accessory protein, partial [Clostridia bacterium]|nr:RNA-binding transcriptional accessory protein [Clostridia bacterium]